MRSYSWIWPTVLGVSTLLIALAYTPLVAIAAKVIGGGAYIVGLAAAIVVWIVALANTLQPFLISQGRSRFSGRPDVAIGGKRWSPPAVNLMMWCAVIATPFVSWGHAYWSGDSTFAWLLCVSVAIYAVAMMRGARRRAAARQVLLGRPSLPVSEIWGQAADAGNGSLEALQAVERALGVPLSQLRPTDRFGAEVGSTDFFDETLDILTSKVLQSREAPAWFDVNSVKTLKDYVEVWDRLRGKTGSATSQRM